MMAVPADHWRHLYHYLYYRVGENHADAEDLLQQVRLAVWKNQAATPQDTWAWMLGITRNLLSHWYRARQRERKLFTGDGVAEDIGTVLDDGVLAAEEMGRCMRLVMSSLEPAAAALLVDKYERNMTLDALAQKHAKSADAVKSALARARELFRRQWRQLVITGERCDG